MFRQHDYLLRKNRNLSYLNRGSQTLLTDGSRQENSAEHSWHLAMMAIVLAEYAPAKNFEPVHAIKMLLVHRIVRVAEPRTIGCVAKTL